MMAAHSPSMQGSGSGLPGRPPRTPVKRSFAPRTSSPLSPSSSSHNSHHQPTSTPSTWRDRFKSQCMARLKESRSAEVRRRRQLSGLDGSSGYGDSDQGKDSNWDALVEEEWTRNFLADEWKRFEAEGRSQGWAGTGWEEEILQELRAAQTAEEQMLCEYEQSIALAEDPAHTLMDGQDHQLADPTTAMHGCVVCGQGRWIMRPGPMIDCTSCDMQITYQSTSPTPIDEFNEHLRSRCMAHSSVCPGSALFSFDQDIGLLLFCNQCIQCEVLA
ncbi:hypothetical protein DFS34DRAFT_636287 [Phlyctochytrium arcticum]|nr:hypothetical protein DFS34DRAFT_636287 [Phlyctochytrium arcticum]